MFERLFQFLAPRPEVPVPPAGIMARDVAVESAVSTLMNVPDPDLVLAQVGIGRQDLVRIETDDEIFGLLCTRLDAVIATPWRLEDAPEGANAEATQWVQTELATWLDDIIEAAWWALPYGYSVAEAVYEQRIDGRIGLARFSRKPLHWFSISREGGLLYKPPGGGNLVDVALAYPGKFFLTRHRATYANPYGEALLSRLYWPWFFRANGWKFWLRFVERFGDPLLLANTKSPAGFVEAMRSIGIESVIAAGPDDKLQAVTSSGSAEFEKLETALTKRAQKLILGQTLTTDVSGTGSYAAAKVHDQVREEKRLADIRMLTTSVQALIDTLVEMNWPGAAAPQIIIGDVVGIEPDRAERDAKLVQSGAVKLTEQYLLRTYDFEPGDIEIPEQPDPNAAPQPGKPAAQQDAQRGEQQAAGPVRFAAGAPRFTRQQQELEDLASDAIASASAPIAADALRAAIMSASSPADLVERLADVYRGTDAEEFRLLMERALFAADVLGYVQASHGKPAADVKASASDGFRIEREGSALVVVPLQGGNPLARVSRNDEGALIVRPSD